MGLFIENILFPNTMVSNDLKKEIESFLIDTNFNFSESLGCLYCDTEEPGFFVCVTDGEQVCFYFWNIWWLTFTKWRLGQQTRYKQKNKIRLKKIFLWSIEPVYITCGMEMFFVLHKIEWSGARTWNDIECNCDLVRMYSRNNWKILDHVYVITIKNKCVYKPLQCCWKDIHYIGCSAINLKISKWTLNW